MLTAANIPHLIHYSGQIVNLRAVANVRWGPDGYGSTLYMNFSGGNHCRASGKDGEILFEAFLALSVDVKQLVEDEPVRAGV